MYLRVSRHVFAFLKTNFVFRASVFEPCRVIARAKIISHLNLYPNGAYVVFCEFSRNVLCRASVRRMQSWKRRRCVGANNWARLRWAATSAGAAKTRNRSNASIVAKSMWLMARVTRIVLITLIPMNSSDCLLRLSAARTFFCLWHQNSLYLSKITGNQLMCWRKAADSSASESNSPRNL